MKKIKKILKKCKTKVQMLLLSASIFLANTQAVFADITPDPEAGKALVRPWISAALTILLFVLPGVFVVFVIWCAIKWFTSTEEEHQRQNPFGKLKKGIIILIIGESIVAIIKVFGIGWINY